MNDLDLLDRSLTGLYAELKAVADLCDDPAKKRFYLGRVAGLEIAMSLFAAWKKEVACQPDVLSDWFFGAIKSEAQTPQ